MLSIQDLPDLVLRRIFATLYHDCTTVRYDTIYRPDKTSDFVPTTAVCRQWRRYALPYMCSIAVCEYVYSATRSKTTNGFIFRGHWRTNIETIISNKGSRCTKEIRLKAIRQNNQPPEDPLDDASQNESPELADLLEQCSFGSAPWDRVVLLNIIDATHAILSNTAPSSDGTRDGMAGSLEYLTRHLPNIRSVLTDRYIIYNENYSGADSLVRHYNRQLTYLVVPCMNPSLSLLELSRDITYLSIHANDSLIHQFPLIHIQKLKYLSIMVSMDSDIWANLYDKALTENVFKSLETLVLGLSGLRCSTSNVKRFVLALRSFQYPKLKSLIIKRHRSNIVDLLHAFPLRQLKELELNSCDCEGIDKLDPRSLQSLARLSIETLVDTHVHAINGFANRLFATALSLGYMCLNIYLDYIKLPETTSLRNIKTLNVSGSFSWVSLARLLARMPKLRILTLNPQVYCNGHSKFMHASKCNGGPCEFEGASISTSIEELIINDSCIDRRTFTCICLLMSKIPSLLRIRIEPRYHDTLQNTIDEKYAHSVTRPNIEGYIYDTYPCQFKS